MSADCVLVVGANGFIGRALCKALEAQGLDLVAIDLLFGQERQATKLRKQVVCDVTDREAVDRLFASHAFTRIVLGGGVSGSAIAATDPHRVFHSNVAGTLNVLEAARVNAVGRILLLSSIAVYGDHPTLDPVREDSALLAMDPYGASKVAAERIGISYRTTFGTNVTALRIASVYGPGRSAPCLLQALANATMDGANPVPISTTRDSLRQFVYIDDAVAAILRALTASTLPRFAYNIGSGVSTTEMQAADMVGAVFGPPSTSQVLHGRYFDGHIGTLNTECAQVDFGFIASTSLVDGIGSLRPSLSSTP